MARSPAQAEAIAKTEIRGRMAAFPFLGRGVIVEPLMLTRRELERVEEDWGWQKAS